MAQSPEAMAEKMIANMEEKTGRPLEEWLLIARKSGESKHGGIVKHLKSAHGMTHGFANLVAHRALQGGAGGNAGDDLVATQYAGPKQHLQPIYDALVRYVNGLGPDVEVAPKKTYVSLRRNKQFALVQPSTRTRVDLGINLKGADATARLEPSGSFNAMVSHRVRLKRAEDIDAEVHAWLKQAYEQG